MKILLIQIKTKRGKEEIKRKETKSRRGVILRADIKCLDKVGIVAHAFNPALGETEAGVSLCV